MALTIYSTPTCPYCKMAKEFFKQHGVEFEDIDVSEDQEEAQAMIEKSGQMGVPVIVVPEEMSTTTKEEVIVGFNRDALSEVLGMNE